MYHPNLDLEGNVCLNILREDWKPVLNLNAIVVGLQYLFLEPNPDDPLNKGACRARARLARSSGLTGVTRADAAKDLRENRSRFMQNVRQSMRGGWVGSEQFENVMVAQ